MCVCEWFVAGQAAVRCWTDPCPFSTHARAQHVRHDCVLWLLRYDSTKHANNGFWPPCGWQLLVSICWNEREFSGHKAVNSTTLQIFPPRRQN